MYRSRSSVFDLNMVVVPKDDVIDDVTAAEDAAVDIVVVVRVSVDAGDTNKAGGDNADDADDNLMVVGAAVAMPIFDSSSLRV